MYTEKPCMSLVMTYVIDIFPMCAFTLVFFTVLVFPFCSCDEINNEPVQTDARNKLNVVIFFTHVDDKCISLQEDTLGFLNLYEQARIKHSSEEQESDAEQPEEEKAGSVHCKELLKDSLMTLTHFCHTVMKMKTAVASVSSKEMTNDIQEPETPYHTPNINLGVDTHNRIKRFEPLPDNRNVLTQKGQHSDNSLSSDKTLSSHKGPMSKAQNIITGAKHTEIFQIRVRRKADEDEEANTKEKDIKIKIIDEVPTEKSSEKSGWDVLDIVKHVRYSFLGKIFENTLKDQVKADQEELVDITKLGKEKLDPGLFSTVKQTLDTLLEPPQNSFLLVIFGGHLHAIADKHSPIVQSIKHVTENTEAEKTLIIVTGSCAEEPGDQDKEDEEKSYTMPLYAKGPDSEKLSECKLLYDIPLTIRRILEVHSEIGPHFPEAIHN